MSVLYKRNPNVITIFAQNKKGYYGKRNQVLPELWHAPL